jgi:hypothetical protein
MPLVTHYMAPNGRMINELLVGKDVKDFIRCTLLQV